MADGLAVPHAPPRLSSRDGAVFWVHGSLGAWERGSIGAWGRGSMGAWELAST